MLGSEPVGFDSPPLARPSTAASSSRASPRAARARGPSWDANSVVRVSSSIPQSRAWTACRAGSTTATGGLDAADLGRARRAPAGVCYQPGVDHIITPELAGFEDQWQFSHVVGHGGLLFSSGVTGTTADGAVAAEPTAQFEQAFTHLRQYLAAAGASLSDVLEMTTYHVGLREHLDAFCAVKDRHVAKPYPAWSAIGVSELITPGALVEIRVIARQPVTR